MLQLTMQPEFIFYPFFFCPFKPLFISTNPLVWFFTIGLTKHPSAFSVALN